MCRSAPRPGVASGQLFGLNPKTAHSISHLAVCDRCRGMTAPLSPDAAYAASARRDAAHDGDFLLAVVTTGIYCKPSCPACMPKRENVRFYLTAGAAEADGYRVCKRCRPE